MTCGVKRAGLRSSSVSIDKRARKRNVLDVGASMISLHDIASVLCFFFVSTVPTTNPSRVTPAPQALRRHTAYTYKGKTIDIRHIGRELKVRYVLEGSVQRSGSRLRVNVQLVDAETSNHLWADRFDKPIADLLDMHDEIVCRVANILNTQLIEAEARRAERTLHPDAMDLCFQAGLTYTKG
jgi:hypothetical protein